MRDDSGIVPDTGKPATGVPVCGTPDGREQLLPTARMPDRVPVACVGVDGGDNAAWLAIRILKLAKKEF